MPIPASFTNPVYSEYLADPFCFHHEGTYYAVGTGRRECNYGKPDGNVVPMVKSQDLQHWQPVGQVLIPPDIERGGCFWAPEVAYHDGLFYMYYHPCGNGKGFHIRVAVAEIPEGPYEDTGQPLTDVERNRFAIDSHPFRDDDGQWYLFYATNFHDFDEHTFRGTALVIDRMVSMTQLEGDPKVVMRAHWQWQRYDKQRDVNGVVADSYTLEGPTACRRGNRYYCFYSGGNYQNESYGVDYLVADSVFGPWREIGCERGAQIMRTIPGNVIGPGHNSIVTSPDGDDYIVYHAWNDDRTARLMCVDPLQWTTNGPRVERFASYIEKENSR